MLLLNILLHKVSSLSGAVCPAQLITKVEPEENLAVDVQLCFRLPLIKNWNLLWFQNI